MNRHLTGDEFVDQLYGAEAHDHLHGCAECSARLEQLRERRAMAAETIPVASDVLDAQRRKIYARMGDGRQSGAKWVPALGACACLIAVALFSYHPSYAPAQAPQTDAVDTQLFTDVYSMEQSMEPIAAQPIHALFEQER